MQNTSFTPPLVASYPKITHTFYNHEGTISPSTVLPAMVGLLMLLGFLTFRSVTFKDVLPGVPELKGIPILGAAPIYLKYGIPQLLGRLVATGGDGISYAHVVNHVLVSVHDPAMVKEVLSYPEEVASREGDTERMSWSPFWTLRRLIGNTQFAYVGPEVGHRRNVFIREFANTKSNKEKFQTISNVAYAHANKLLAEGSSAEIEDIRRCADNYALDLWGEILYGVPDRHIGGKALALSEHITELAGDPWVPVWYWLQLVFGLVKPGNPSHSESKIRRRLTEMVEKNVAKLEVHELNNPDAPLKTIRNLSVNTGGGRTGPLSKFASEFANLNLFGGHHSIGLNVTWSFIELDRHPECLAKLMAEIESVDITDFDSVNSKMPYLDAVIMEINRLHPVVHATLRVINRETKLASSKDLPVVLKPGMLIYLSFLYLHTSKNFWGPDAGAFNPERFMGGYNKEQPFLSFGSGPRNCVGYKFATLAGKVYLITLLKTYKVDVTDHDHEQKLSTLLETTKPVAVKVTRRF